MEENMISVHMDYRNQRHSYISNTDFSSKNDISKKEENRKNTKIAEESSDRNLQYSVKNIRRGMEKNYHTKGKKKSWTLEIRKWSYKTTNDTMKIN